MDLKSYLFLRLILLLSPFDFNSKVAEMCGVESSASNLIHLWDKVGPAKVGVAIVIKLGGRLIFCAFENWKENERVD